VQIRSLSLSLSRARARADKVTLLFSDYCFLDLLSVSALIRAIYPRREDFYAFQALFFTSRRGLCPEDQLLITGERQEGLIARIAQERKEGK